jgi:hypothetical protein
VEKLDSQNHFRSSLRGEEEKGKTNEKIERPVPGNLCWSQNRQISLILEVDYDYDDDDKFL